MRFDLAPLAGFTDAPFRTLACAGGADRAYTEMVSAAGLRYGSSPTEHLLETMEGEGPVVCQLFGATEEDLAAGTAVVEQRLSARAQKRVVALNLNAGCPMTKVTRCGAGAALVKDPAKIGRLVKAMVENTSLSVTVKTRLGPHPQCDTVFEIADAAAAAGAKELVVHARYTSEMHGGPVHLEKLAELVRRSPIPVIGNGSVVDRKSAAAMAATGVQGLMVGRAALANPAVFAHLKGMAAPDFVDSAAVCRRHLELILAFRRQLAANFPDDHIPSEDAFASVKMHVHLFRYFSGRPGAAALRARLNSVRTLAEIREIIASAYTVRVN